MRVRSKVHASAEIHESALAQRIWLECRKERAAPLIRDSRKKVPLLTSAYARDVPFFIVITSLLSEPAESKRAYNA